MSITTAILLVVVILIAAAAAYMYMRKRRSERLRAQFGPEYQHAVMETGNRDRAERALEKRAERARKYNIHPLSQEDRDALSTEWRKTQALFVDDPSRAVRDADRLICDAMQRSGYPATDYELRAEDLSVEHPNVIRNYRAAHDIAVSSEKGQASTEDLRKAMVYCRSLFDELLLPEMAHGPVRR